MTEGIPIWKIDSTKGLTSSMQEKVELSRLVAKMTRHTNSKTDTVTG